MKDVHLGPEFSGSAHVLVARVHRAQDIAGTGQVHDGEIKIGALGAFPRYETLDIAMLEHRADAQLIADVLIRTLPGGTVDQLTAILLQHKASRLVVPL